MNGALKSLQAAAAPCFLQINQAGSWRSMVDFDSTGLPCEFLEHADKLVRLSIGSGRTTTMRIVIARQGADGSAVATGVVLARWDRMNGWLTA